MTEIAILLIAIIYTLTVIMLWNMNDKVIRLEALTKCLESEMIALRKQINKDAEGELTRMKKEDFRKELEDIYSDFIDMRMRRERCDRTEEMLALIFRLMFMRAECWLEGEEE